MALRGRAVPWQLEQDCQRIRKLDTLKPEDRAGKYRVAIEELTARALDGGQQLWEDAVFGGLLYPRLQAFETAFLEDWLKTLDYQNLKDEAKRLLLEGDYDGFVTVCKKARKISRAMVLAWGGKEEADAAEAGGEQTQPAGQAGL